MNKRSWVGGQRFGVGTFVTLLNLVGGPGCNKEEVCRGERLGFAGLVGAGRTEFMQVLLGVDRPLGGRMLFQG